MARKVARGLTLVEIIISLLILSLVFILVLNLFPSSMATARRGEQILQADTIAGSLLDEYAARPFGQLNTGTENLSPIHEGGVTYNPRIEIGNVAGSDSDHLRSLRAVVEWEIRGQTRRAVHVLWVANVRR